MKRFALAIFITLLLVMPVVTEGGVMAKQKLLVLDPPYAIFEDWTHFEYTSERFGLGTFEITIPLDHSMSGALQQYHRVLIVKGDDDWDNQEDRLWGVILDVKKSYAPDAGPDLGGSGEGAAFVTATGVTFTDYCLGSRIYPIPDPVTLLPNGDYVVQWGGSYTDVDEGVDDHDSDTSYIYAKAEGDLALFQLENYTDQGTAIAGVRLRQVWRGTAAEGVVAPCIIISHGNYPSAHILANGNGADTDWTGDYEDVDDPNPPSGDGDTTYINSSTVTHRESVTMEGLNWPSNALPWRVLFNIDARKTTVDAVILKGYLTVGGTRYYHADTKTLTDKYDAYQFAWTENPATSTPWTVAALNDLEYGVEIDTCDGGEARVTIMFAWINYVYKYELNQVYATYVTDCVEIPINPYTGVAWTDSDLDDLIVGSHLTEDGAVRVTAMEVVVYHKAIQTTGALDDVLKDWVNANLGSGADAGRQVTGFTEEGDESAGPSDTWEIGYNVLLQRFLELCKGNDVGMNIVGNWNSGATRLDASPSYEFQTSYPEGANRTHNQSGNDPIVLYRGRGTARGLAYELDTVSARNYAYLLGEKDGLKQATQEVAGQGLALAQENGGLILKEDGWPILAEGPTGFYRRECVLDVNGADTTTQLTAIGEKFLGDEGAEMEKVEVELVPGQTMHEPITDYQPGDFITFYDDVFDVGPIHPRVESITCRVPSDGVERYSLSLGPVKRPALTEDAAFRAAAKRKTIYTQGG